MVPRLEEGRKFLKPNTFRRHGYNEGLGGIVSEGFPKPGPVPILRTNEAELRNEHTHYVNGVFW